MQELTITTTDGKEQTVKGYLQQVKQYLFFVHRSLVNPRYWQATEITSQARICFAKSKQEAIEKTKSIFISKSNKEIDRAILGAKLALKKAIKKGGGR